MRNPAQPLVLALALLSAAPAARAAPGPAPAPPPAFADGPLQLGIGVAILPFGTLGGFGAPVEVYLPILVARDFRLEPSLGLRIDNGPSGGTDRRDLTLGVGAFLMRRLAPAVDLLVGGRLKLNLARSSGPGFSESGTDLFLAGAVGGEYYLASHFSLGLEADLGFFQNSRASGDDAGLLTTGLAFLRVYF